MPTRKPLLIITGFLGSGKTTLVRTLLSELFREELKASVILNDIGSADLDAATILSPAAESITPISASCACCESLDELVSTCENAAQGTSDLLLIELNGTGDPLELLGTFMLLDERLPFSPKLLVCVIDVRHWGRRGELTPLEKRQMQGAGLYILSHTDCAKKDDINRVKAALCEEFPNSKQITAKQLGEFLINGSALLTRTDQACQVHQEPKSKECLLAQKNPTKCSSCLTVATILACAVQNW